jgi:hypothetical protein
MSRDVVFKHLNISKSCEQRVGGSFCHRTNIITTGGDMGSNFFDDISVHTFVLGCFLDFLNNLWGLGTGEEEGFRTGPPGYIGWRNSFLGIDSGAPYAFKNTSSGTPGYIGWRN